MTGAAQAARILVITGRVPYSTTEEAFVQDELETMLRLGTDLLVVPARLQTSGPNQQAVDSGLVGRVVAEKLLAPAVLKGAARILGRRPVKAVRASFRAVQGSGGLRNLMTNVAIIPKALWIAGLAHESRAEHIHSYWLAHTTTAAMIAGEITGIPWSATGFRWDIDARNSLRSKLASASFIRVADELGQRQIAAAIAQLDLTTPSNLVRTGVLVPDAAAWRSSPLTVDHWYCPGAFVEKKGHTFLLDALLEVRRRGRSVHLDLFGDGPLKSHISAKVAEYGLTDAVTFHGVVPLAELRACMMRHRPVVVLPSIRSSDGQEEGIPVVLIEAMANGCPVVSTTTGSIPTLITPGCGTLVPDEDPEALADALDAICEHPGAAGAAADRAYERVRSEFDRETVAATMLDLMAHQGTLR